MRLIDADKYLEKVCTYKETGCGSCKLQTMCLKDATTVEAIPIEWLRMWFSKNGYLSGIALVDKIETDWKEENEQNKESTSQTD